MTKDPKPQAREMTLERARYIPCKGCPTVECTCFTDLEQDLLDKVSKKIDMQSEYAQKVQGLVDALEDAIEALSSNLEQMQHYFENQCCPTVDEVNQLANADSRARIALAAFRSGEAG